MAAARLDSGEVSSTVKSGSDQSHEEDDDEVLRISYKDAPDDFFDNLVTDEFAEDKPSQKQPPAPAPVPGPRDSSVSKDPKEDQPDLRKKLIEKKKIEFGDPKKKDDKKVKGGSIRKSRSPEKRRSLSPRKVSPKRGRLTLPQRRGIKRRAELNRPPAKIRKSVSPVRGGSPRRISPRRSFRKSPSPRRDKATRKPSPRRSPVRRRSGSRSPRRRRSPSPDLFAARMNSRRTRLRRSISPVRRNSRGSISLSPEPIERAGRIPEPRIHTRRRSRSRSRTPPRSISLTPPPRRISRTPPPNPFMPGAAPLLQQPSLEEIASGAAQVPYQMPYGGYPPPGQMMYNYPHPQAPYHPAMMPYQQPYPGPRMTPPIPAIGDVGTLSTAYPLPQPVPKPRFDDPGPPGIVPPNPLMINHTANSGTFGAPPAPQLNKPVKTIMAKSSIASGVSSNDVEEPKNNMKLSDYLASMTANNKPMEYKKHVDDRIKAAIARFDATFLQPLRFQVTPSTVQVKDENEAPPNQSPLLKNPSVKLGKFIRPLNLRALKVPDKPQFVCRKPDLAPPKPEISIKKLLAKKQASRKDSGTSPIRVQLYNVGCQTDPIPEPEPPICLTCEERSKKTYINHWTQMKPIEVCHSSMPTVEVPAPRLGPPVKVYEQEDLRLSLRGRVSPWEYENPRDDPHELMEPQHLPRSPIQLSPEVYGTPPPRYASQSFSPMPEEIYRRRTRSPSPQLPPQHYHEYVHEPQRRLTPSPRRMTPPRRVLTPPRRVLTPPRRVLTPPRRVLTPPRRVLTPPRRASPPMRRVSPLPRRVSPPQRRVSPPQRRVSPLPRRLSRSPMRSSPPPQQWRRVPICEDCNLTFNSEKQKGDHMRSERHRLRVEALELEAMERRGGHHGYSHERRGQSRPSDVHHSSGPQWQRKQF